MKSRILVITSTTRQNRTSHKVAEWYVSEAQPLAPDTMFEILDIAELNLSFFDEPIDPLSASQAGKLTKQQQELASKVSAADGYVFVTAEYNHGIPAPLKNFLDHLPAAPWRRKPAAFVGYGVRGAYWSVGSLLPIMGQLELASLAGSVINIKFVWEAFDDKGSIKPEYMIGNIESQLQELLWWTEALKAARQVES